MMIAARRSITDIIQTPAYKSLFGTIYAGGIGNDATDAYKQADYAFNDVIAKTTWRPNDRSLFYISLYSSNDDLAINYQTKDQSNNFQYQFSDISSWGNRGVGAGLERMINSEVNTQVTIGASRFSSELFAVDTLLDFRDGEITRIFRSDQNVLTDLSIQNDWHWKQHNGEYTFGAQWKNLRITRILNDLGNEGSEDERASLFSIFAQREWRIKAHQLNVGGRFNYFEPTGKWYPEWRLNYSYAVSNTWKVKGASSLTYQFVHRTLEQRLFQNLPDIWMISDGNELPVMKAIQGSLGALYHNKGWTMDMEIYYKELIDQAIDRTQWSSFADIAAPYLVGRGFAKGLDLLVAKEWNAHHVSVSYTLSKARITYPDLDQEEAVPPAYDQLHEVKVYYELKLNNWEASAIWVYGSGRPYTQFYGFYEAVVPGSGLTQLPVYSQINEQRLDPYHRLDLSIGYIWSRRQVGWEFRAGCYNIYNQQNIRDVQYLSFPSSEGNYVVEKRNVLMLGRIPSIQITMTIR
jgi:hypothetical protein